MFARIPVLLLGIPAAYGLLVAAGDTIRLIFLALICILGQFELGRMLERNETRKPWPEWAAAVIMLTAAHLYGERGLLLASGLAAVFLMAATVLRGLQGDGCRRFCHGLFSLLYLPFCLSFFLMLAKTHGGLTLFVLVAAIWALDIGAYAFGMSIRGPRLAPKISPNKTISGAVGGALSCMAFIMTAGHLKYLTLPMPNLVALAISVAVLGQLADLFESILKRESEVKDSGALLGAHGGILDRIDSILFLGPVCYTLFTL
ncbi:MAG: phosphatidate cytidylyltransferase [Candidatus Riflebacteria bacterium]|jgi:phosphatidate cytidylyltransferase|nr:phosphatidate cytidylyltransferase [Candidatus Riflebacteria bacterium]